MQLYMSSNMSYGSKLVWVPRLNIVLVIVLGSSKLYNLLLDRTSCSWTINESHLQLHRKGRHTVCKCYPLCRICFSQYHAYSTALSWPGLLSLDRLYFFLNDGKIIISWCFAVCAIRVWASKACSSVVHYCLSNTSANLWLVPVPKFIEVINKMAIETI